MDGRTVKCKVCGEPYKVYAFSAADQSACPTCVQRAERNMERQPAPPLTESGRSVLRDAIVRLHTEGRTIGENEANAALAGRLGDLAS